MINRTKRKLQLRFVALSMAALLLLQGLIVSISIYYSYAQMVQKSDLILSQLQENPSANVRFFSVKLHPGKGAVRLDTVQHVSVTPEQAGAYAKNALETQQEQGFVDEYRFRILRNDGGMRIVFLSRASSIEMHRTAAENLIWVSLAGLAVMGILLSMVSGWVVTPLLENQRKQKQFITAASHELKTPLTVISTNTQMLQTEIGDNPWIDGILQQTAHLTQMTNTLVSLAKADEYEHISEKTAFSLPEAVKDALEPYKTLAEQKSICLTVALPDDFSYKGNENEIRHLVRILLDNALKYCPELGKIAISLRQTAQGGQLCVRNTADNISVKEAAVLTQRFYRGQNSAGKDGFGLGLSIAQSIAAHHNGKLTVSLPSSSEFLAEVTLR